MSTWLIVSRLLKLFKGRKAWNRTITYLLGKRNGPYCPTMYCTFFPCPLLEVVLWSICVSVQETRWSPPEKRKSDNCKYTGALTLRHNYGFIQIRPKITKLFFSALIKIATAKNSFRPWIVSAETISGNTVVKSIEKCNDWKKNWVITWT